MTYHQFLEGNRIYLRGIEKCDLQGRFLQWANDKEVTRFLFMGVFPNVLENLEEWFEVGKLHILLMESRRMIL